MGSPNILDGTHCLYLALQYTSDPNQKGFPTILICIQKILREKLWFRLKLPKNTKLENNFSKKYTFFHSTEMH
jgi:hypothetical protein